MNRVDQSQGLKLSQTENRQKTENRISISRSPSALCAMGLEKPRGNGVNSNGISPVFGIIAITMGWILPLIVLENIWNKNWQRKFAIIQA